MESTAFKQRNLSCHCLKTCDCVSVVYCKTAVFSLLMQWRFCCVTSNHGMALVSQGFYEQNMICKTVSWSSMSNGLITAIVHVRKMWIGMKLKVLSVRYVQSHFPVQLHFIGLGWKHLVIWSSFECHQNNFDFHSVRFHKNWPSIMNYDQCFQHPLLCN